MLGLTPLQYQVTVTLTRLDERITDPAEVAAVDELRAQGRARLVPCLHCGGVAAVLTPAGREAKRLHEAASIRPPPL